MDQKRGECLPPFVPIISLWCQLDLGIVEWSDRSVLLDILVTKLYSNHAMKRHYVFGNGLQFTHLLKISIRLVPGKCECAKRD